MKQSNLFLPAKMCRTLLCCFLAMSMLFVAACSYSGRLGHVSCEDQFDCPGDAQCREGFCIFDGDGHLDAGDEDANSDGEPDSDSDFDGDAELDAGPDADVDGPDTGPDTGPDADPDVGPDADTGPDADPDVGPDADTGPQCVDNTEYCEEVDACIDTQNDREHCGECDDPCPTISGTNVSCKLGECEYRCEDALLDYCPEAMDNFCRDLQTDDDHCGSCGSGCSATQFCEAGQCQEPTPQPDCDPGATLFGGGQGISGDPYLICSAAQLNTIGASSDYLDSHFQLAADIDLADLGADAFNIIGGLGSEFDGVFDGNGRTITNLVIDTSGSGIGMFGSVSGVLRNITLIDVDITGTDVVGGLAGGLFGTIEGSKVYGVVSGADRVGGLVGATGGSAAAISNSHTSVDVSGASFVGGLVGRTNGTISGSSAEGEVTGTTAIIGGLTGQNWRGPDANGSCLITDSHAHGDVFTDQAPDVGGLVGRQLSGCSINESSATGEITGHDRIGGLVGWSYPQTTIIDSHAFGDVTGRDFAGGLAGLVASDFGNDWSETEMPVQNSSATGDVTGRDTVGGLIGRSEGTISQSHSTGEVEGNFRVGGLVGHLRLTDFGTRGTIRRSRSESTVSGNNRVGGLVGEARGLIFGSHATGDVSSDGDQFVGGLVGHGFWHIERSYATGSVDAPGVEHVGGLVGRLDNLGRVENSYSIGDVTGDSRVGGLIGEVNGGTNSAIVINSYYTIGGVTGDFLVGGLVGRSLGTVENSFWNSETSDTASSAGGDPLTSTEFSAQDSFDPPWDFTTIWIMTDTRPALR